MDTYLQRHPYAYTTVQMARSPPSCRRPYQSSRWHPRKYILAYFIHKNNFSNIFWALSEVPRGSRPTSSNLSPYDTHLRIFSPPLYRHLNKRFYSGTPTSNVTPSRIPRSDPPPCVKYIRSFWRLSSSILTIAFTQALPPPTSPLHQHSIRIPLLALRTLRFSPASLPRF